MTSFPKITLCYTTVRAGSVDRVVNLWLSRALTPVNINFSITTDANCQDVIDVLAKDVIKSIVASGSKMVVDTVKDLPGNCVKGWNLAVSNAKELKILGDIIIAVADDFEPPDEWDRQLVDVAEPGWWLEDRVVHIRDGYNTDIFTLAILTKTRFDKFGYIFYPQYLSLFSDTEFTAVALNDGVVIQAEHLLFEHLHPDCGKRQRDNVDLLHASKVRWNTGEMLFNYRRSIGFPVDEGPVFEANSGGAAVTVKDLAVYVQAIRDDFCLFEVCARLYEEGLREFFFYIPDEFWSGKQATKDQHNEIYAVMKDLAKLEGLACHACTFPMKSHRAPGRSRIQVETHARNEALAWIRSQGFKHIVIADGDELWRHGLLKEMLDMVNDYHPACIYTGMVPVVGLPGYPIEGAIDKASIYIGNDANFSECRGTNAQKLELFGHKIFHFTATRRTMEEIIQKHRDSGHYDDKNYDFEGWIANKLPNLRPGFRNAHMHIPFDPWPVVREWKSEELNEIPSSLHQYLSGKPTNTSNRVA